MPWPRSVRLVPLLAFLVVIACSATCNVVLPVPGEAITPPSDRCDQLVVPPEGAFTVATFNIHGGRGRDGFCDLARVAAVVIGADFVGMQEVSRGNLADGFLDQPMILSGLLGHPSFAFFTVVERAPWDGGGSFGNAFTSSLPVLAQEAFELPSIGSEGPRGLGWVQALVGGRAVDFFVTHLTLTSDPNSDIQAPQVDAALEIIDAIRHGDSTPCVLMGDFNTYENGVIVSHLLERYNEVVLMADACSEDTADRRDYIFVSRDIEVVTACLVPNTASDHPAVVAVLSTTP
ncbi:MAG: endonuclease/exonuclease/phosphatase family protein [Phycisphaerae bacterium]|nr:endonuclease/exonuclease/phosphatase family protein [Phycisphaerae bacterium]